MSDIIHLLPDSIANQIAAGEVIQRPASVVKELVENAVDAGATDIRVNIKEAGRTLIQVIDNGEGMSETDARMAFERHATSKITKAEDLFALQTMGFRGEALASIAAIAHIELRTRTTGSELGTRLSIAGSELQEIEADACVQGSVFSVKNLFFNVPARRKFLKSNETEFRNIIQELERITLVNPHIAFSLYHNDAEILNLPISGIRQRIVSIFGKNIHQKLLTIEARSTLVTISGFIGRPDFTRKRGALQYFFVNGRYMRHPYFHRAVLQAFEQLIPAGEFPAYFIYFTLDPQAIDVNIHPTKTEIKFENEQAIWQIILSATREALAKSSAIPTIDFDKEDAINIPVYSATERALSQAPKVHVDSSYNPFKTSGSYQRPEFDWNILYKGFEADQSSEEHTRPQAPAASPPDHTETQTDQQDILFEEQTLPAYQYKSRYIITSLKSGLAFIDQHRAHVRILFDRYVRAVNQQKGFSQQVLFPEIIEFTPAEAAMIPCFLDDLHFMGFDLSDLGNGSYAINGLPSGVEHLNPVALLKEVVVKAIETGCEAKDEICEALALSLAKAAAIRAGKTLSAEEMEHLIAALFSTPNPNLTPEGKTILTIVNDEELEKRFK